MWGEMNDNSCIYAMNMFVSDVFDIYIYNRYE